MRLSANYASNHDQLQYIATKELMSGNRYILGTIDQETVGITFRVDYFITPELSIQYYGSPFISKGTYSDLKRVTDPENADFENRFDIFQVRCCRMGSTCSMRTGMV